MSDTATMHIDGAARGNPGPASYAVVLARPGQPDVDHGQVLARAVRFERRPGKLQLAPIPHAVLLQKLRQPLFDIGFRKHPRTPADFYPLRSRPGGRRKVRRRRLNQPGDLLAGPKQRYTHFR